MTTSNEPRDNSDLPEHRVAMVVFTTVRAVDLGDAALIAKKAIVDALTPTSVVRPYRTVTITARLRDDEIPVQVSEVAELGATAYGGLVSIQPTNRAYPREEDR